MIQNDTDMNKKEVIKMAEKYSGRTISQVDYMAGFQAACNIVREKLKTCYNDGRTRAGCIYGFIFR